MFYAEGSRLVLLARKLAQFIVCKPGLIIFLAAMLALPLCPQTAQAGESYHSCAVQHGGVQCWGAGGSGAEPSMTPLTRRLIAYAQATRINFFPEE